MAKYLRKHAAKLATRIKFWESQGAAYQKANTKPGSIKK